jgi:hypothetical protein
MPTITSLTNHMTTLSHIHRMPGCKSQDSVVLPTDAQRDALSTEVASPARSILLLLSGKGSETPLSYGNMRAIKDALKPAH